MNITFVTFPAVLWRSSVTDGALRGCSTRLARLSSSVRISAMCLSCEVWQRNNFGTDVALVIADSMLEKGRTPAGQRHVSQAPSEGTSSFQQCWPPAKCLGQQLTTVLQGFGGEVVSATTTANHWRSLVAFEFGHVVVATLLLFMCCSVS